MICELYLHRDVKTKVNLAMPVHVFMWSVTYTQTLVSFAKGSSFHYMKLVKAMSIHPPCGSLSGFQIII